MLPPRHPGPIWASTVHTSLLLAETPYLAFSLLAGVMGVRVPTDKSVGVLALLSCICVCFIPI